MFRQNKNMINNRYHNIIQQLSISSTISRPDSILILEKIAPPEDTCSRLLIISAIHKHKIIF